MEEMDMKKIIACFITAIMVYSMGTTAFGATAYPSNDKIMLNKTTEFYMQPYSINGYNYFKLRAVCGMLQGTVNEFDLNWNSNEGKTIIRKQPLETPIISMDYDGVFRQETAIPVDAVMEADGKTVTLQAYNIKGYNYFKLRDLADLIGFKVGWDASSKTVNLDAPYGFVQPAPVQKPAENKNNANGSVSVIKPGSKEYQKLVEEVKKLTSNNYVSEKGTVQIFTRGEFFEPVTVTFRDIDERIYFERCTFHSTLTVKGDYELGENLRLENCTFAHDSDLILK